MTERLRRLTWLTAVMLHNCLIASAALLFAQQPQRLSRITVGRCRRVRNALFAGGGVALDPVASARVGMAGTKAQLRPQKDVLYLWLPSCRLAVSSRGTVEAVQP